MLSGQSREHLSGWRDNRIEDLLFAIGGIEVADDLDRCLNVRIRDELTDTTLDRLQAVNESFNLVIDR